MLEPMNTEEKHPHVLSAWDHLLAPHLIAKLDQTTFLSRCRSETVSRRELEIFLVQQNHYSRHFTRYLCALLVHLGSEEDRQALIENLFEEMGYGELGDEPHSKIYRDMLTKLDLDPSAHPPLPETTALVDTMLKLCSHPNPMMGLGALCLGAEAIVPHVYSQIMKGLLARGFPQTHLRFFPLHIDGDDDHALTMKAIIDRELRRNPESKSDLLKSAEECILRRVEFFDSISRISNDRREVMYAI